MKNKRGTIIIILVIGIYLVFAVILFGWDNLMNKFQKMYIMLDPDTMWKLEDGKWLNIENDREYNWQKFDVYINNKSFGKYSLLYNKKWYLFDNKKDSQKYNGELIAIRGNKKYSIIDFEEQKLNEEDNEILKEILSKEDVEYSEKFTSSGKVIMDINGDNKKETIYAVSNAFTEEDLENKFSIIFIKNDKYNILYKNIVSKANQYDVCVPRIKGIIDINKDSKYELIFECNYFSTMGTCHSMYQQENGKYRLVKGC